MKIDYDKCADVLYITVAQSKEKVSFYKNAQEQIVRVDENNKVVGVLIPRFSKRCKEGEIIINEL
jgi:uncharacterized protein YuzE